MNRKVGSGFRKDQALAESVAQDDFAQDDRVVVLFVTRAINERNRPAPRQCSQMLELIGAGAKLGAIALPKLLPATWVVSKPFPKLGARSELLYPLVDAGLRLFEAARPQPIDEDASPVIGRGMLIRPLQSYVRRWNSCHGLVRELEPTSSEGAGDAS
jgi:hypothetical protein